MRPENGYGYLTLGEAKWQWQNGQGAPVTVDANKLDLSGLRASDFRKGVGSTRLLKLPRWWDFVVHGTVRVRLNPNLTVGIVSNRFNFDMKPWFEGYFIRNLQTLALKTYVGRGHEFMVHFRGTVPIPP